MEVLRRPPRVRPGDVVAVVSPGFGAVGRWPHRVERATAYLDSLGLRVRVMPNAGRSEGWASAPPEDRAADLHAAFADDEVAVVLASIGGNHSNQLLPFLDVDLIAAHPKVFHGYSDVTVLHWAIAKHAGLATFYGPALVSELGEFPRVLDLTDRCLRAAWFGAEPMVYEPATEWTEEFLDWDAQLDSTRARTLLPGEGWVAIRGGTARGPILAGCLETICWHLKGSSAWIDPAGAILLLETSEEAPSPAHVDAYLTDLEQLGVFESAAAVVFGRPKGYAAEDVKLLWEVVARRTETAGLPVLANVDAGHTDPMLTMPIGVEAELDADAPSFRLLEPPTVEA
ncbi:MAG TPA: S66 peptidase family protein [Gaiellaceae bacterium]|nr:S66 peptidase family protein [Gaiellaceae bacterium]